MISKRLVTLKNDVPLKNDATDFIIKDIDKDKLYNFLRDMEFNRLLSQSVFMVSQGIKILTKNYTKKTIK